MELSILPQDLVERETYETDFRTFVDKMLDLQDDYLEALNGTSPLSVAEVLSEYEGTQVLLELSQPYPQRPCSCPDSILDWCPYIASLIRQFSSLIDGYPAELAYIMVRITCMKSDEAVIICLLQGQGQCAGSVQIKAQQKS